MADQKDPVRVLTGRMGALTVHSRGKTNTVPSRAAFEAKFAAAVDPEQQLDPVERERRAQYAQRLHMTRLARARWHRGAPPTEAA
jgi:hypothetical protein